MCARLYIVHIHVLVFTEMNKTHSTTTTTTITSEKQKPQLQLIQCTVSTMNESLISYDPNMKIVLFQVTYMVFLVFYSYVILFDFRPTISVAEWVIIAWIASMLVEEFRQVLVTLHHFYRIGNKM